MLATNQKAPAAQFAAMFKFEGGGSAYNKAVYERVVFVINHVAHIWRHELGQYKNTLVDIAKDRDQMRRCIEAVLLELEMARL
jgi:hypothetical protein